MPNPFTSSVLDDASRTPEDPLSHGGDWQLLGGQAWLGERGERPIAESTISQGAWVPSDSSVEAAFINGNSVLATDDSVMEVLAVDAALSGYSGDIYTIVEFGNSPDSTLNVELIQGTTIISHQESDLGEVAERPFIFPVVDTASITDYDDLRVRFYYTGTTIDGFGYVTARLLTTAGDGFGFALLAFPPPLPGDGLIHVSVGAVMWVPAFGPSDREIWIELEDDFNDLTFPIILGFLDVLGSEQITYAALFYPASLATDGSPTVEIGKLPFGDTPETLSQNFDDPTWAAGDILGIRLHSGGVDAYQWDGSFATLWGTSPDTAYFDETDNVLVYSIGGQLDLRSVGGGDAGAPPTSFNKLAMIL